MAERRAHPRAPLHVGVGVRLLDGTKAVADGTIRNISMGGMFIGMADPLDLGTRLRLSFLLPKAPYVMECGATVMRSVRIGDAMGRGVGVQLNGLDDVFEDILVGLIPGHYDGDAG